GPVAGVPAPRAGPHAGPLRPPLPRRVVRASGAAAGLAMRVPGTTLEAAALAGAVRSALARVRPDEWLDGARAIRESGGRLVALWGVDRPDGIAVLAAFAIADGLCVIEIAPGEAGYPPPAGAFPAAPHMQRAVRDVLRVAAHGA